MRTFKVFLTAFLSLMLLAACNQSANNTSGQGQEQEKPAEQGGATELNADEILDKSIKAMSELKSYSMEMDLDQEMNIPGEDAPTTIKGKIKADITMEPFALYQKIALSSAGDESFDTETYMNEDGFFMSNPEDNSWMKLPGEFGEEMKEAQGNADEQLQLLKGFSEDITITEEGNDYVLTVKGSGEKFMELTKELLQQMGGDSLGDSEELLSMMDMKKIDFIINIDKETFYQTKIDLDLELEMTVEDETMSMKQKVNGTLSNFDGVEAIVIPDDVKNNAEEVAF